MGGKYTPAVSNHPDKNYPFLNVLKEEDSMIPSDDNHQICILYLVPKWYLFRSVLDTRVEASVSKHLVAIRIGVFWRGH